MYKRGYKRVNKFKRQVYLSTISPHTPESHTWTEIGWCGVVANPQTQVHIVGVFGAAAQEAVVHAFVDIACPLPDVACHVVQAVGGGRIQRDVVVVRLTVVEADGTRARPG